ncbi:hypothetical protein FACS189485_20100 [Spirochaetia bacterium]|nr:hypothetical protein FACS189485_20100 [Spirochaetia bacterium]
MTLEQTIEIPASRHVAFDLPFTFPIGKVKVELIITPEPLASRTPEPIAPIVVETDVEKYPWEASIGLFKDAAFSSEELFKERARDLLRDEAKLFRKISPEALEQAAKRGVTPEELGLCLSP